MPEIDVDAGTYERLAVSARLLNLPVGAVVIATAANSPPLAA